jgi:peptidase M28-like protein
MAPAGLSREGSLLSRWTLALPLVLAVTAFAGCIDDANLPKAAEDAKKTVDWTVPELPHVDAKMMLDNHAKFVSTYNYRANNSPGHQGARDYMAQEFQAAGLELFRHKFTNGIDQEDVCGIKLGSVEPAVWVVVGGHYDTTTWDSSAGGQGPDAMVSQGAYDDGSGTRITIELAKAFAPLDTYYSILFCAFDGEERGLQGSGAMFKAMQDSSVFPHDVEATRGMIDFDMMGICWPIRAPIQFDWYSQEVYDLVNGFRKEMGIPDDMFRSWKDAPVALGTSDYGHWQKAKIPTAFFISDFEGIGVPTPVANPAPVGPLPVVPYPFWHFTDTVETMTAMAGGPDMLQKGFQTALDLGVLTLAAFALEPDVMLPPQPAQ